MEMIDHDRRVRQQPRRSQRGCIHRGRVDRHILDALAKLGTAFPQPLDHRGAGAALALPQQALIAGQVDESGVPRVDPHPPPACRASLPAGLAAAGLVDAEHPHRLGFGQQRLGVGDERSVRGRPRHPVSVGDLGHRAGRVADGRADLGA
jgi:hypothetical protein